MPNRYLIGVSIYAYFLLTSEQAAPLRARLLNLTASEALEILGDGERWSAFWEKAAQGKVLGFLILTLSLKMLGRFFKRRAENQQIAEAGAAGVQGVEQPSTKVAEGKKKK